MSFYLKPEYLAIFKKTAVFEFLRLSTEEQKGMTSHLLCCSIHEGSERKISYLRLSKDMSSNS